MNYIAVADSDYQRVCCPSCKHVWYAQVTGVGYGGQGNRVHCPECYRPLRLILDKGPGDAS